jgi:ferric iron reductase protein FhuF
MPARCDAFSQWGDFLYTGTLQIGTAGAFSTFHCDPGHFGKAKFTEPLYQPLYESCPLHESHFESRCCCFRYECAPVCPVCVPCVSRCLFTELDRV